MSGGKRKPGGGRQKLPTPRPKLPEPLQGFPVLEGREVDPRPSARLQSVTRTEFALRQGPIPDAEELVRYGQAHPDAPAIILDEFKLQTAHRRSMDGRAIALDEKLLDASIFSERLGVVSALFIALVGFGCATYLIAQGHGVEGTTIFGIDVGGLVSAFILGRPKDAPAAAVESERTANRKARR